MMARTTTLAKFDTSPGDGRRLYGRTRLILGALLVVSLAVKLLYLSYRYLGFVSEGTQAIFPDESLYLERAQSNFQIVLGEHWLYEHIGHFFSQFCETDSQLFLVMGLYNVALSLLLPFVAKPIIEEFTRSDYAFNRTFLLASALMLLAPSSIWLASSNLKDVTVALLSLLTARSVIKYVKAPSRLLSMAYLAGMFLALFLMFSIRSYFAVMFFLAIAAFFAFGKPRGKGMFFSVCLSVAALIFLTGYGAVMEMGGRFLENNWLFSPRAIASMQAKVWQTTGQEFVINQSISGKVYGALLFLLGPLPSVVNWRMENLVSLQVGFYPLLLFAGYHGIRNHACAGKFNIMFFSLFGMLIMFYATAQSYAGPRQRFGTFDVFLFAFAAIALSGGDMRRRTVRGLIMVSIMFTVSSIVFTAKGNV